MSKKDPLRSKTSGSSLSKSSPNTSNIKTTLLLSGKSTSMTFIRSSTRVSRKPINKTFSISSALNSSKESSANQWGRKKSDSSKKKIITATNQTMTVEKWNKILWTLSLIKRKANN